jgi:DsbC/DsbD-like thiol-disulfide interchange protein
MRRRLNRSGGWASAVTMFALLMMLTPNAVAQSRAAGPHATVTLLSDRDAIVPDERMWIGLRFQMEKGWHIYWVNPGDSGEPPKVQWQLPAGFHVAPIEWPAPEKLTAPSIVDYGYENEVLLMAPVRVPAHLTPGANIPLAADVNWLVCKDICIPAKAHVTLTLPARGAPQDKAPSSAALFVETEKSLPRAAQANWKITAISEKDGFVLTVETGTRESAATFFPLDPEQIKNDAAQAATPFSRGVRLRLQKSDGLLKPISALRGVLVFGTGRAYTITALVRPAGR